MSNVRASAIVDLLTEVPEKSWRVEVWGEPPHEERRVYTIRAATDHNAAQEGIRQFVDEMARPPAGR